MKEFVCTKQKSFKNACPLPDFHPYKQLLIGCDIYRFNYSITLTLVVKAKQPQTIKTFEVTFIMMRNYENKRDR